MEQEGKGRILLVWLWCFRFRVLSFAERKASAFLQKADIRINGSRPWDIQVHNDKFFLRLLLHGTIALGESYVDGWWDCHAIDQFIYRVLRGGLVNMKTGSFKGLGIPFVSTLRLLGPILTNRQTKKRSARDIRYTYDLGNDVFIATLDKQMSYSCGYWKNASTLDEAQEEKHDLICRKLHLKPGMKLLEIGCGFGGFARFAAEKYGVHVVGITTSKNHYTFATEYCRGTSVKILQQDYREIQGKFDRIVCIEMMEHVGPKNHQQFIETVFNALLPNGLFLLQSISISESVIRNDPWIDKYIFPGTVPLSAKQIADATEGFFCILDWHNFTKDYYRTMLAWHDNFERHWESLKGKYDDRFRRLWKFYLLCCPATALAGTHHLWQIVFSRIDSDKAYERVS